MIYFCLPCFAIRDTVPILILTWWYPRLTHWCLAPQVYISKWVIQGSGNGLAPNKCQAIPISILTCQLGDPQEHTSKWNSNNKKFYSQENAFENVCECLVPFWPGANEFRGPFTKGLQAHNPKLVKVHLVLIYILMIRSGHNFVLATTAQLLWQVQSCDLIWWIESRLEHYNFHEISVMSS